MPLILPSYYTSQPQSPTVLDPGNPLCRGIVDAFLPIAGRWRSIQFAQNLNTTPQDITLLTDTASPTYAARGGKLGAAVGKKYNGSTQYSSRNSAPFTSFAEMTLLMLAAESSSTAFTDRAGFGYSSSASDTPVAYVGQGSTSGKATFRVVDDAANAQATEAGTFTFSQGLGICCLIGTRSNSLNFQRTYFDGRLIASSTATSIGTATLDRTAIGASVRTTAQSFFPAGVYLAVALNRALDPSEVTALSVNPWQIFLKPPRKWYIGTASSSVDFPVTLSPGAVAFAGSSLTVTVKKNVTLSAGARPVAGSNLTETVGKNVTLSAGARTFAGSNLTETVTKVIGLTAGAQPFAGSNLTEQAPINIALSPGARPFTGSALTFNVIGSGGGKDGGGGHVKRLPYGWWADPEYVPSLKKKAPLKEIEKEIVREAIEEVREESGGMAATLLANLVEPYTTNERIDWQAINRVGQEIQALRQAIAAYRKEQQEEAEDEEAILLLAH